MFFLDTLPRFVSIFILTEWLLVIDIARLDSATSSSSERCTYLFLISSQNVVFTGVSKLQMASSFFDWLSTRKLSVFFLSVNAWSDETDHFRRNAKYVRNLKALHLHNFNVKYRHCFVKLADRCNLLHELKITNSTISTWDNLLPQGINKLVLSNCRINWPSNKNTISLPRLLCHINLSNCKPSVDDDFLFHISNRCDGLTSVDLTNCTLITDCSVCFMTNSCSQIRSMNIDGCVLLSDKAVCDISTNCLNLTVLNISNISTLGDCSIECIADSCIHLTTLVAHRVLCSFSKNVLMKLVTGKCCNTLRILVTNSAHSFDVLQYATNKCPHLTGFVVTSPKHIIINTRDLFANVGMTKITHLEMFFSGLNDVDVAAISNGCPVLEYLSLSKCIQITDAAVVCLTKNLLLTRLDLSYCRRVSDDSIYTLAENCNLLSLNLSRTGITFSSRSKCTNHSLISLHLCNGKSTLGVDSIVNICEIFPMLTTIYCRRLDIVQGKFYLHQHRPNISIKIQNKFDVRQSSYCWM